MAELLEGDHVCLEEAELLKCWGFSSAHQWQGADRIAGGQFLPSDFIWSPIYLGRIHFEGAQLQVPDCVFPCIFVG